VAKYIEKRDGFPSDPSNIFLTNGASEGVTLCMRALIKNDDEGLMIPIP
jgi:aspartate/methionine/tyrosine aminotransferase